MQVKEQSVVVVLKGQSKANNFKISFEGQIPKELTGRIVSGEIIKADSNGKIELKLPDGTVLKGTSEPPLPQGSKVMVKIPSNGVEPKVMDVLTPKSSTTTPSDEPSTQTHLPPRSPDKIQTPHTQESQTLTPQKQIPTELSARLILAQKASPTSDMLLLSNLIQAVGKQFTVQPLTPITQTPSALNILMQVIAPPHADGTQTLVPLDTKSNTPALQIKLASPLPAGTELQVQVQSPQKIIIQQGQLPTHLNNLPLNKTLTSQNIETSLPENIQNQIRQAQTTVNISPNKLSLSTLEQELTHVLNRQTVPLQKSLPTPPKAGDILTFTVSSISAEKLTLTSLDGAKIALTFDSKTPVREGANMTIRFTPDGAVEVLRIVDHDSVAKHPRFQEGQTKGDMQAPSRGLGQEAPLNLPKSSQVPNLQPLVVGQKYSGTIVAQGEDGHHTLTLTNGRTLQIQSIRTLPLNSVVHVQITPDGHAEMTQLTLPAGTARTNALTNLSLKWQTLNDSIKSLESSHPDLAKILGDKIPKLQSGFLPSIMNFASSIIEQSPEKFAGKEVINILRSFGIDFSPDFVGLHQSHLKTDLPDGWRALLFPYVEQDGEPPRQGGFFWRQNEEDNDSKKRTRFVVQIALSQLGPIQLDALLQGKDIHFKLKLHQEMSDQQIKELKSIVRQSLESYNFTGGIEVEKTERFELDPLYEMLSHHEQFKVEV